MFQLVTCNLAVLSIAMIYYAWRDGYLSRAKPPAVSLNERVAYMLWTASQRVA